MIYFDKETRLFSVFRTTKKNYSPKEEINKALGSTGANLITSVGNKLGNKLSGSTNKSPKQLSEFEREHQLKMERIRRGIDDRALVLQAINRHYDHKDRKLDHKEKMRFREMDSKDQKKYLKNKYETAKLRLDKGSETTAVPWKKRI